jgi:hypothetical protein
MAVCMYRKCKPYRVAVAGHLMLSYLINCRSDIAFEGGFLTRTGLHLQEGQLLALSGHKEETGEKLYLILFRTLK